MLTERSADTIDWLRWRANLTLDRISQLGGHSFPRTHRPSSGMAGTELVRALQKQVETCANTARMVYP